MQTIISQLKASPLFQLSLSSKELFHSNFFYWVAKNYSVPFGKLLATNLNLPVETFNEVKRESRNIDIEFYMGSTKVIIENKVKSVPEKDQLLFYKEKHPDAFCILLSMIKPQFDLEEIGWHHLDYDIYLDILEKLNQDITDDYHKALISDYVQFTCLLKEVVQSSVINEHSGFKKDYTDRIPALQEIRLHDIFVKSVINQFSKMVVNKLNSYVLPETIMQGNWNVETPHIQFYWGIEFLKGKGIFYLNYVCKGYLLGFMVDGHRLLQYIEKNNLIEEYKQFASDLETDKIWFNSLTAKKMSKRKFNQFNEGRFLYQYEVIGERATFGEMTNKIVGEIVRLKLSILPELTN